ncbi:MAG: transposase [Gammaproteobacteria bacterium]|nr:transposase [Gammaproteobacteria bacterium]
MSANTRLFSGSPVASVEALIEVYPAAMLTLYQVITKGFPGIVMLFSRPVYYSVIVMVTGLCVLAKKPTSRAIADTLGVVSHDALTRLLTHSCWSASLLLGALINHALLLSTGAVVPSILILDDVLVPKPFARWIAGAYWDWDHAQHRRTFGHRIVVVVWTNGVVVIPVAFALWHKRHSAYFLGDQASFTETEYQQFLRQFPPMRPLLNALLLRETDQVVLPLVALIPWQKRLISKKAWAVLASHAATTGRRYRTKNELARCLSYHLVRKRLCCDYITFDCWYASKEHVNMLTRLGLVYVTAVPCSRKLSTARRLRSRAEVIPSARRVDEVANTFATRDYVPYRQARLRA